MEQQAVSWANNKQPGNLICYKYDQGIGHVGIYIGNNRWPIHAGSTATNTYISMKLQISKIVFRNYKKII